MVAVIKSPSSVHRPYNYNENKVKHGVAECLLAENYPMEEHQLSVSQKLNRLLNQIALNENVKRNSIHISLNFAPGEQLSKDTLCNIAKDYMEQIGFGEQPYLVYQHHDAGHPHLHIVSVTIRSDGSRINTQNIGRNQSEAARKSIEHKYGLVKAEDHKRNVFRLKPVSAERIMIGKTDIKRAITDVLDAVLNSYHYTSLPELNALLGLYNVTADRGAEDSRTYQHEGLYYRVLNDKGEKVGVPIKASEIYSNPGLKFLQKQFQVNLSKRNQHKQRLQNTINLAIANQRIRTIQQLLAALKRDGVDLVLRKNKDDIIYGVTYVDHKTKCVFNGSAIGEKYSTNAIKERFALQASSDCKDKLSQSTAYKPEEGSEYSEMGEGVVDVLFQTEQSYEPVPWQLKRSRKGRKRNQRFNNQ